jgi:hypothetical protein
LADPFLRCLILALLGPLLAAAAPGVPQQRQIDAGLRPLRVALASDDRRPSDKRFPLSFPLNRTHALLRTSNGLHVAVHSHGTTPGRYASITFELLFWDTARHFEEHARSFQSVMAAVGLPEPARAEAVAAVRALNAKLVAARPVSNTAPPGLWFRTSGEGTREAADLHIRTEGEFSRGPGGSTGFAFVQITDGRAPQARWPAPADVERLFPYSRRRAVDVGADIPYFPDPVVAVLRCRSRGPDRYRCRYEVAPGERFTDDFAQVGGEWRLLAPDAAPVAANSSRAAEGE